MNRNCQTHRTRHFDRIRSRHVGVQSLPPGDPARGRITQGDEALEDLGGAFLDGVVVAAQAEHVVAVRASFTHEFLRKQERIELVSDDAAVQAFVFCAWLGEGERKGADVRCEAERGNKPCRREECAAGLGRRSRTCTGLFLKRLAAKRLDSQNQRQMGRKR